MQKHTHTAEHHKRPPVIDLSSDQDSDTQSQKQNRFSYSYNASHTQAPKICHPAQHAYMQNNHNLSDGTTESQLKPSNQLQFSTLSLDQNSILNNEKSQINYRSGLATENEQLKRLNWQLQKQILQLKQTIKIDRQDQKQYQQKLQQLQIQIEQTKSKNRKLQSELLKLQKSLENKRVSQQLPIRKSIADQSNRIYAEVMDKIKGVIQKYLTQLSKQKMNVQVQSIITDFVNQLIQLNPDTRCTDSSQSLNQFSSIKNYSSSNIYRSKRNNKFMGELNPIGQEYRLLQKSIDKLKHMERDIDQKTGSFLKKQLIEGNSMNKGIGLDQSSISVLQRSKSRRKRIFQ